MFAHNPPFTLSRKHQSGLDAIKKQTYTSSPIPPFTVHAKLFKESAAPGLRDNAGDIGLSSPGKVEVRHGMQRISNNRIVEYEID